MSKKIAIFFVLILLHSSSFAQQYEFRWSATRPTPTTPDATSVWLDSGNWLEWNGASFVPTSNTPGPGDDVLIPSGTNTCTIADVADPLYGNVTCQSLTIQSDAAVDNNLLSTNNLEIERDLIIEDNAYIFTNATRVQIGRDLWIQEGADNAASPGGSFIVRLQDCEIQVGRHYFNEGTMAKQAFDGATLITLTLNGADDALLYAKAGERRTSNKIEAEDLVGRTTFNFGYLITDANAEVFKTGAFDKVFIQKTGTSNTIQNSAKPTNLTGAVEHLDDASLPVFAVNTTNVRFSIMSGIVGDGVGNFDGTAGVDAYNVQMPGSTGQLEITGGTIIISDVTATFSDENYSGEEAISGGPPIIQEFRVYDDTEYHPRDQSGGTGTNHRWDIPQADINVRGNLVISADAGVQLYQSDATGENLCLHLGGNLTDNNTLDPTTTTGLYVGPFEPFDGTRQSRPFVIFNGESTATQEIEGFLANLHDFNNVPNLGQGITLPNVYVKKPAGGVIRQKIGSGVHILGDLTIFSGEYDTNGELLEMGDHGRDEINILALDATNPLATPDDKPDVHGVLRVTAGTTVLVGNVRDNCFTRQFGAYIRVRKGGYLYLQGTTNNWVAVREHGVQCSHCRMTTYAGGVIYAQYCSLFRPQERNENTTIAGEFTRDATLAAGYTDTGTDATHFSGYSNRENGGYSVFPGGYMMHADVGNTIDCFSNCSIFEAGSCTHLSIDTYNVLPHDLDPNDGSNDYDLSVDRRDNMTISGTNLQGSLQRNYPVVSLLPIDDPADIATTTYQVTFKDSNGELGGVHGEDNDKRITAHVDDRILWENQTQAVWTGEHDDNWDDARNWEILGAVTMTGAAASPTDATANPNGVIPGINAEALDIIIPCESNNNCIAGKVNSIYNIDGGIYIRESDAGFQPTTTPYSCSDVRRLIIQENVTPVVFNIKGDIFIRKGGVLQANNGEFHLEGGILMRDGRRASDNQFGQLSRVATLQSGTSTFYMEGAQTVVIYPRHNQLYNLVIDKDNEGAIVVARTNTPGTTQEEQQNKSEVYTWMINGSLTINQGTLLVRNGVQMSVQGDFIQKAGVFNPIESDVVVRGNFLATGGSYLGSTVSELRLYPLPTGPTSKTIKVNANTLINNMVIGDGDDVQQTNRKRYLKSNGQSYTSSGSGSGQLPTSHTANPSQRQSRQAGFVRFKTGHYIQVPGVTDSTGTSRTTAMFNGGGSTDDAVDDPIYTYVLESDFTATGTITIKGNRVLNANGFSLVAGDGTNDAIGVLWRGRLEIESNLNSAGSLQVKPGSALRVSTNGEFSLLGLPSRYATLTRSEASGSGNFEVRLGGILETRYYIVEHLWDRGVYLNATAKSVSSGLQTYGGKGQSYTNPQVTLTSFYEGAGAAFDADLDGSPLDNVVMTNSGKGYSSVPTVNFIGTANTNAAADAILVGSPVSDYNMTNGGEGYTSTPTVTFSAPTAPSGTTTTAVADIIMSPSEITDITSPIASGGMNFTTVPDVTFATPSGGLEATGEAVLNASTLTAGQFFGIEDEGNGYTDGTYTETTGGTFIELGTNVGGTVLPTFEVIVSSGSVVSVQVLTSGDATYELPISIEVQLPTTGEPPTFVIDDIQVAATSVKEINILDGGEGYVTATASTVTISGGGGTGAAVAAGEITITSGGDEVIGLDFDCPTCTRGEGYLTAPTISFSGGSPTVPAEAVAVTEGGKITGVTFSNQGDYNAIPTVTFTGGGVGTGASVEDGDYSLMGTSLPIGTISIPAIRQGQDYQSPPRVEFIGGGGSGAVAEAVLGTGVDEGKVISINVLTGGSGYISQPDIVLIGANEATGYAEGTGGVITGFTLVDGGSNYQTAPLITITDGIGTNNVRGIGFGAAARSKLNPSGVVAINVLSEGSGYTAPMAISVTSANGDGTASTTINETTHFTVTRSGTDQVDAIVLTAAGITALNGGYTTAPNLSISSAGSGSNIKALLTPGPVVSVDLDPFEAYPSAAFSDGIFSNLSYSATGASSAFTINEYYNTYRDASGTLDDYDALNPLDPLVTYNYSATPAVDTVYNVIFAENPARNVTSGNFDIQKNVIRASLTGAFPSLSTAIMNQNRVVFRDALGTFAGEKFEGGFHSRGGSNNGTDASPADNYVDWRNADKKLWDGGPDNTNQAWNDGVNWFEDGIPQASDDILIDYTRVSVDYTTNNTLSPSNPSYGQPILNVPNPIEINMDYDFDAAGQLATGQNLEFDPFVRSLQAGGNPLETEIILNIQNVNGTSTDPDMQLGGTISIPDNVTINITSGGTDPIIINIGESWINEGRFNDQGALSKVDFYKNSSRVISNIITSVAKDANSNIVEGIPSSPTAFNGFNDVSFSDGQTSLLSDIWVKGDLLIDTEGDLTLNSTDFIYLEGDWTQKDDITGLDGTVYFRGNQRQEVNFESALSRERRIVNFGRIAIDKSTTVSESNVYLNNRIQVNTSVAFYNGRFVADTDGREFILSNTAGYAAQPNNDSFVQGPTGRIYNSSSATNLSYPVGGDDFGSDDATFDLTFLGGDLDAISIVDAGTNYIENTRFKVPNDTDPNLATDSTVIEVTSVDANGAITGVNIIHAGSGFTDGTQSGVSMTPVPGTGRAIYLGDNTGSVDLEIALKTTGLASTLITVNQIERNYEDVYAARPYPSPYNSISDNRYWKIENLEYFATSTGTSSQGDIDAADITLSLVPSFETIGGIALDPVDIQEVGLLKDDPSGTSITHERGLATPGTTAWIDLQATASIAGEQTDFTTTSRVEFTSGISFGEGETGENLGAGTFVFGLNNLVLPLEILDFQAKRINDDQVLLEWVTVDEQYSQHFVVERSQDGVNFEDIHQEVALGLLGSGIANYEYTDKDPHRGINYYRIRQVEFDGNEEYTVIRAVNIDQSSQFVVYPNPSFRGDMLRILAPVEFGEKVNIRLLDVRGMEISNREIEATSNVFEMEVSTGLIPGVYILEVLTADERFVEKLLIK